MPVYGSSNLARLGNRITNHYTCLALVTSIPFNNFVNLFIILNIILYLILIVRFFENNNLIIKFYIIDFYGWEGISKVWNWLYRVCRDDLFHI